MLTEFEDRYLDVLQNIECSLLSLIKDHPELSDYDMLCIIEYSLAYYKFQRTGRLAIAQNKLTGVRQKIFEKVLSICEWRLGKSLPFGEKVPCGAITIEELLLCLKRIEKSIKFWTKQGGRKGYINFVAPRVLVSG